MTDNMFGWLCLTTMICTAIVCSYLKFKIKNTEDKKEETNE